MKTVILGENISKQYRLGQIGTGSMAHDVNRWWYKVRGKEDPYLKIGQETDRDKRATGDYVWALRDVSFKVEQGEVLGIIGRNGAGKSTLLKILSRTTLPTTGSVKVKGRIASLLEVGTGFHPELSGRDNIFLNGAILGMSRLEIKRKFDEIVDFAGVAMYIDTPVKRYSSGMYVRLAFAIAAYLEPEILIVDEVLAVGDADFQKKCLGKMKEVSDTEGRTVLFVSHNMAAIDTLCTRGLVLNKGRVDFDGKTSEALAVYAKASMIQSGRGSVLFTGSEPERFGEKVYNKLQSLELMNADGEVTDTFMMGEKMVIAIVTDVLKPSDDFEIGIGIGNYHGVYPHYFVSSWEGFSSISKSGLARIEIEVPKVVLFPGQYTINVWICVRGAYYDDAVHNALSFSVLEGKVNEQNTYFERFSKNTQVYVKTNWTLK